MLCANRPISSSERYSNMLCKFPSVSSFATSSMACNGSKMLESTFLLVFLEFIHARLIKNIMKATPKIAHNTVFLTALSLAMSVISSNFKAISTNLFNAGVHLVRISSTPFWFCPCRISSIMDVLMSSQSDNAVAYSV